MDNAFCRSCGYSLRGLPEHRCPECGTGFRPGDRNTYYDPGFPSRGERFLLSSPGWPINGGASLAATTMIIGALYPGDIFLIVVFGTLLWFAVGTLWVLRIIGFSIVAARWRRSFRVLLSRRWLLAPSAALLVWLALWTGVPCRVALLISIPSLRAVVAEMESKPVGSVQRGRWIGVFRARSIEHNHHGVLIELSGTEGLFGSVDAVLHSKSPDWLDGDHGWTVKHLLGDWYHVGISHWID